MQVQKTTVDSLFTHERRYVIPLFQRPYVWTEEDQWEPLWDDISSLAERELDAAKSGNEAALRPHFLGAIVLQPRAPHGDHLTAVDVIDGQQRITTLQILLRALRDVAALRGDEANKRWCVTRTENPNALVDFEIEQHKLWPTQRDQKQFLEICSAGSRAEIEKRYPAKIGRRKQVRPVMIEAYLYFHRSIEAWFAEHAATADAGMALRHAIQRRLELVQIDLDVGENPQEIFETLNARGVPLLASDLLRNFVFRRTQNQEESEKLHKKYWARFEVPDDPNRPEGLRFWEVEGRQGRLSRARLDLFVQHYLAMQLEHDVRIGELFSAYRGWIEGEGRRPKPFENVEQELAVFGSYADHFATLVRPGADRDLARIAECLIALDTSTAYPLVLWILGNPSIDKAERRGMYRDIESFLVRRLVCGRPTNQYTRRFIDVVRELKKAPKPDSKALHDLLRGVTADAFDWPDDDEFEKNWNSIDAYRMLKPSRVELILRTLELESRSSKSEPITLTGPLTVEHVMPQDWTHWPLPGVKDAEQLREEVVHDFGNLTLLTQGLNSTVSNGPAAKKLPAIVEGSNLQLSKYFVNRTTWTEDDIRERGRALFVVARKVWSKA